MSWTAPPNGSVSLSAKDRLKKAIKRARTVVSRFREGRGRLTYAGVLPVGLYGAEHEPWSRCDIDRIIAATVRSVGILPPAVPVSLASWALPASRHPEFQILFTPLGMWAREVWLNRTRTGPTDVLNGLELRRITGLLADHDDLQGPAGALMKSLQAFGGRLREPHLLELPTGTMDLTRTSPGAVKFACQRLFDLARHNAATAIIEGRVAQRGFPVASCAPLAEALRHHRTTGEQVRTALAVLYGSVPTGKWLHEHGWATPGLCPECGAVEDGDHDIDGCFAKGRTVSPGPLETFRTLVGQAAEPPTPRPTPLIQATIDGVVVPLASFRFVPGHPIYTDGSARDVQCPTIAVASGAAVQEVGGFSGL